MLNVLIACEESQRVCAEFRKRGCNAFSCDILPCSGNLPQYHIQGDATPLINGDCDFITMDGVKHHISGEWDLLIAHPPCTYLTVTGNKWYKPEYADRFPDRIERREKAVDFFMLFANAKCAHIAIENPVGIMSTRWRKPDQYIEPYYFGECEKKKTGFWLIGLPPLTPTNIVKPKKHLTWSGKYEPKWHMDTIALPSEERSRIRSQTFKGVAEAIAEQWYAYLCNELTPEN